MDYLILSVTLLVIGIYGLVSKRHLVKILISIELIAIGASMNFVLLASSFDQELGQVFLIIAFSTDTGITAIVLALLIIVTRKYGTADLRILAQLEESEQKTTEEVRA